MKASPISKFAVKETRGYLRQFKKHLRHTAMHPEDPEAIHDLRVSIRRLSQCFRAFRGLLQPAPVKKLRGRLRKVMDHCGAVRNCDVALDLLQQSGIAAGASVSRLKKTREQSGNELRRHLKKERRRNHSAPGPSRRPPAGNWKVEESSEENLGRILPTLAEEFFKAGEITIAPGATLPDLHRFRLSSKRFRYTLELFEGFYGAEISRGATLLKGVQDRLGAINDCAVTMNLLRLDRRAVSAIAKLLGIRIVEFQEYWKSQFRPSKLAWWRRWLSHPSLRHSTAT